MERSRHEIELWLDRVKSKRAELRKKRNIRANAILMNATNNFKSLLKQATEKKTAQVDVM